MDAFFEILNLNNIVLSDLDKFNLSNRCRGQSIAGKDRIKYRDALTMINVDNDDMTQWIVLSNNNYTLSQRHENDSL